MKGKELWDNLVDFFILPVIIVVFGTIAVLGMMRLWP